MVVKLLLLKPLLQLMVWFGAAGQTEPVLGFNF
jgi:hypothetical protein